VIDQVSNPYKNNIKLCISVNFNLDIRRQQTGRKRFQTRIIASVFKIQSALNFLKNAILILCNVLSKYLK
jgi:hypothetical protein